MAEKGHYIGINVNGKTVPMRSDKVMANPGLFAQRYSGATLTMYKGGQARTVSGKDLPGAIKSGWNFDVPQQPVAQPAKPAQQPQAAQPQAAPQQKQATPSRPEWMQRAVGRMNSAIDAEKQRQATQQPRQTSSNWMTDSVSAAKERVNAARQQAVSQKTAPQAVAPQQPAASSNRNSLMQNMENASRILSMAPKETPAQKSAPATPSRRSTTNVSQYLTGPQEQSWQQSYRLPETEKKQESTDYLSQSSVENKKRERRDSVRTVQRQVEKKDKEIVAHPEMYDPKLVKESAKRVMEDTIRETEGKETLYSPEDRANAQRIQDTENYQLNAEETAQKRVDAAGDAFSADIRESLSSLSNIAKEEAAGNESAKYVPYGMGSAYASGYADAGVNMQNILDPILSNLGNYITERFNKEDILADAEARRMDPETYIYDYLAPALVKKLEDTAFSQLVERGLPKSGMEYLMQQLTKGITGNLISLASTPEQKAVRAEANRLVETGQNPYYKPSTGMEFAGTSLSFMGDIPYMGGVAKGINAVAPLTRKAIAKRTIALANRGWMGRLATGVGDAAVRSWLNFTGYNVLSTVSSDLAAGQDVTGAHIVEAAANPGAFVGAFGSMYANLFSRVGLTGLERGFGRALANFTKKQAVNLGAIGVETGSFVIGDWLYGKGDLTLVDFIDMAPEIIAMKLGGALGHAPQRAAELAENKRRGRGVVSSVASSVINTGRANYNPSARIRQEERAEMERKLPGEKRQQKPSTTILGRLNNAVRAEVERNRTSKQFFDYLDEVVENRYETEKTKAELEKAAKSGDVDTQRDLSAKQVALEHAYRELTDGLSWDAVNALNIAAFGVATKARPRMESIQETDEGIFELDKDGNVLSVLYESDKDARTAWRFNKYAQRDQFDARNLFQQALNKHIEDVMSMDPASPEFDAYASLFLETDPEAVKMSKDEAIKAMQDINTPLGKRFSLYLTMTNDIGARLESIGITADEYNRLVNSDPRDLDTIDSSALHKIVDVLDALAHPTGEINKGASVEKGKRDAEQTGAGTDNPNAEGIRAVGEALDAARNAFDQWLESGEEVAQLVKDALAPNAGETLIVRSAADYERAYLEALANGAREEQLAPLAELINAMSRQQAFMAKAEAEAEYAADFFVYNVRNRQHGDIRTATDGQGREWYVLNGAYETDQEGRITITDQAGGILCVDGEGNVRLLRDKGMKETSVRTVEEVRAEKIQELKDKTAAIIAETQTPETPAGETPPTDDKPADNPPKEGGKPADNPPADNPPADNPPADNPPTPPTPPEGTVKNALGEDVDPRRRGHDKIVNNINKFRDSQSETDKVVAYASLLDALYDNPDATAKERAFIEDAKKELEGLGYEFKEPTPGEPFDIKNPVTEVTSTTRDTSLKEGEKVIDKVESPIISKDGKIVKTAKVTTRGNITPDSEDVRNFEARLIENDARVKQGKKPLKIPYDLIDRYFSIIDRRGRDTFAGTAPEELVRRAREERDLADEIAKDPISSMGTEESGAFDKAIGNQSNSLGDVTPGTARKKKPEDWAAGEPLRPNTSSVHHDPAGYGVMTDGVVLYYDKGLYDPDNAGESIATKTMKGKSGKEEIKTTKGEPISGAFPRWRMVLPAGKTRSYVIDPKRLASIAAGMVAKAKDRAKELGDKWFDDRTMALRLPDGRTIVVGAKRLTLFADAMKQLGATDFQLYETKDGLYRLYATTEKGGVLLVCGVRGSEAIENSYAFYDLKNDARRVAAREPVRPAEREPLEPRKGESIFDTDNHEWKVIERDGQLVLRPFERGRDGKDTKRLDPYGDMAWEDWKKKHTERVQSELERRRIQNAQDTGGESKEKFINRIIEEKKSNTSHFSKTVDIPKETDITWLAAAAHSVNERTTDTLSIETRQWIAAQLGKNMEEVRTMLADNPAEVLKAIGVDNIKDIAHLQSFKNALLWGQVKDKADVLRAAFKPYEDALKDKTKREIIAKMKTGDISIDEVEQLYHAFAAGTRMEKLKPLADKVFSLLKKMNMDIKLSTNLYDTNGRKLDESVIGHALGGRVRYRFGYLTGESLTSNDEAKATVLLHELIHSATTYAIRTFTNPLLAKMRDGLKARDPERYEAMESAVNNLKEIYDYLKREREGIFKIGSNRKAYGMKTMGEMVAEMANPNFRDMLKQKNLWKKFKNSVLKLLGINTEAESDAEKTVEKALDSLLDNFDEQLWNEYDEMVKNESPSFRESVLEVTERIAREEREKQRTWSDEEEERRKPIREKLRSLSKLLGVKVNIVESQGDIDSEEVSDALDDGLAVHGWYYNGDHHVNIYIPDIVDAAHAQRKFFHEAVVHYGLRKVYDRLGEGEYDKFLDRVWQSMSIRDRRKWSGYKGGEDLIGEDLQRFAAEEYIARMAENTRMNRGFWDRIASYLKGKLGIETLSGVDVRNAVRASYRNLKREAETVANGGIEISGVGRSVHLSTSGTMEGGGMILEKDEKGKPVPPTDEEGNLVYRIGGKEYSGKSKDTLVTVEALMSEKNSTLSMMIDDALRNGTISRERATMLYQKYADILNSYLVAGSKEHGGAEAAEGQWRWLGETIYRTIAKNSDAQYGWSMDITRVCKKNEMVIKEISEMQLKQGFGVTPAQVMDIYSNTREAGYQTPCPVCYVFSRYIRNGKYATAAIRCMEEWGEHLPGGSDEWTVEQWGEAYKEAALWNERNKAVIDQANEDLVRIPDRIDSLRLRLETGKLSKSEREDIKKKIEELDARYRAALNVNAHMAKTNWIKTHVLKVSSGGVEEDITMDDPDSIFDEGGKKKKKKSEKDKEYTFEFREGGAMRKPEDMDEYRRCALDLRQTAFTMEKYPAIQRLRKSGGAAAGKEITFASNNDLGEIIMGVGAGEPEKSVNFYKQAMEAYQRGDTEEAQKLKKKASDRFAKAVAYAARQSLRGGQRMWSWSDNIESLSPDVAVNLMQLEMLGGALQTYTKQLEGAYMVSSMKGYTNGSLMAKDNGWRQVSADQIETVDGRRVLKEDITETITEPTTKGPVERKRILAEKGSAIYTDKDGDFVLLFDDVIGIDPHGINGKTGLFGLNKILDRCGNIIVGMNDRHIKAALADPRIFFCIPWHSSGANEHILAQMFDLMGTRMRDLVSTDYTNMQEEKNMGKTKAGKYRKIHRDIIKLWEDTRKRTNFDCAFEDGVQSGQREKIDGVDTYRISDSQMRYRDLRKAIFDGTIDDPANKEMKDEVMRDEFLRQVYKTVHERIPAETLKTKDGKEYEGHRMTSGDNDYIYPYEYWDTSSTYDNAHVNNDRYLEYCRRLGRRPKFTGKWSQTGKRDKSVGDFSGEQGYWKLLIDRRMYGVDKKYQDLTAIDSEGFKSEMIDPVKNREKFHITEVADDNQVKNIVDRTYDQESERTSRGAPTVDYTKDGDTAVREYVTERAKTAGVKFPKRGSETTSKKNALHLSAESREEDESGDLHLSYGAPYQGSKNRIAKRIIDLLPKGKRFVDLFSGGGAMTHAAIESGKYERQHMNDIDDAGQRLFLDGARGKWRDRTLEPISEEEFAALKNSEEGRPEAILRSAMGKGQQMEKTQDGRSRTNEQLRRVQSLEGLDVSKVSATKGDYRDVKLEKGDVVYCDIPYEKTNQEGYQGTFDKQAFIEWAQKQDGMVFVSEFSMPEGWTEIASFDVVNKGKRQQEKLWVQDKFAADYFEAREKAEEPLAREMERGTIHFSVETDPETLDRLNKSKKVEGGKLYRAMVLIDGKLYPPMASKEGKGKRSALKAPSELGVWERSDEAPDKAFWKKTEDGDGWYIAITKDDGKSLEVAYNPYFHASTTMLNDQFMAAQTRPNLVIVECDVPESELEQGYKADKAKDPVGMLDWKAGPIQGKLTGTRNVMLSRWMRPMRIVGDEEVAKHVMECINGEIDEMPSNVVTPSLRKELEKLGMKFVETDNKGNLLEGPHKGITWSLSWKVRHGEELTSDQKKKLREIGIPFETKKKPKKNSTRFSADLKLKDVKEFVEEFEVPENISSRAQAAMWAYDMLGRVRGMLNELYGDKASKDFTKGILSTDSEQGRKIDIDNALYGRARVNQYLDFVQPILYQARDNSTSEEARKYFQNVIDECNYARQWYERAANGDTSVIDDNKPRFSVEPKEERDPDPLATASRIAKERREEKRRDPIPKENPYNAIMSKPRPSKEERKILFSTTPGRYDTLSGAEQKRIYEDRLKSWWFPWREAWVDRMASLKDLCKGLTGVKSIDQLKDIHNVYRKAIHLSSVVQAAQKKAYETIGKPLLNEISRSMGIFGGSREEAYNRVHNYLWMKSALERNRVLKVRDLIAKERNSLLTSPDDLKTGARAIYDGLERATNFTGMSDEQKAEKRLELAYAAQKLWVKSLEDEWKQRRADALTELKAGRYDLKDYYADMDEWIRQYWRWDPKKKSSDYSGLNTAVGGFDSDKKFDEDEVIKMVMDEEAILGGAADDLWAAVKNMTAFSLKTSYESGNTGKAMYDHITEMMDWYTPMRGWSATTAEDLNAYFTHGHSGKSGDIIVKRAGGRTDGSDDCIATMIQMMDDAIYKGEQNKVKQALWRLANATSTAGGLVSISEQWLEKVGVDTAGNDIWEVAEPIIRPDMTAAEVAKAVRDFNDDMRQKAEIGEAMLARTNQLSYPYKFEQPRHKSEHAVEVKLDGNTYIMYINSSPRAAQALNGNIVGKDKSGISSTIQHLNRYLAATFTSWNPTFVFRNIIRDGDFARTNLLAKEGWNYLFGWHKEDKKKGTQAHKGFVWNWHQAFWTTWGMWRRYNKGTLSNSGDDKLFAEFMANGGQTGYVAQHTMDEYKKQIDRDLRDIQSGKGVGDLTMWTLRRAGSLIQFANNWAENIARFATYKTSRTMGRSVLRSIADAKDASTNFNIKGAREGTRMDAKNANQWLAGFTSEAISDMYVFVNPAIQSLALTSRNFKGHPVRASIAYGLHFLLGTIWPWVTAMYMAWRKDDDEEVDNYANLPSYVRDSHISFYVGNHTWLSAPLSIETSTAWKMGQMFAANYLGFDDLKSDENQFMDLAASLTQLLPVNPLQNHSKDLWVALAPTAVAPLVQIMRNKKWTGVPIEKDEMPWNKGEARYKRATSNTSPLLVNICKYLSSMTSDVKDAEIEKGSWDWSPGIIENLAKGYTGGVGTFLLNVASTAKNVAEGKFDTNQMPLINGLTKKTDRDNAGFRANSRWYAVKDEMDIHARTLQRLEEAVDDADPTSFAKYEAYANRWADKVEKYQDIASAIDELEKILKEPDSEEEAALAEMNIIKLKMGAYELLK